MARFLMNYQPVGLERSTGQLFKESWTAFATLPEFFEVIPLLLAEWYERDHLH